MRPAIRNLFALVFAVGLMSTARADVVYDNGDPFGGPFGPIGFDVGDCQSVGVRFTPGATYTLDQIGVWFMNNDFSGATHPLIQISLRPDAMAPGGGSIPSDTILEQWTFNVSAVGWDPQLETVVSALHPTLQAGTNYWVVCASQVQCGNDGVWNWSAHNSGFNANTDQGHWQPGAEGAVSALIVRGSPAGVIGDIDGDGDVDADDVDAFVRVLLEAPLDPRHVARSDLNGDSHADGDDIQALVARL